MVALSGVRSHSFNPFSGQCERNRLSLVPLGNSTSL